ncbi:hypothetical protein [Amycolatopsis rifamycinica]|uniref:DUF1828 domain-containing protein n=1 Tax=Amycolatopsis rifamycinica TaxID=287986 RepID=A0A066U714_9PSEU|nr:hypothetical protein [Amycolatopsis rifamycinica]KDN23231.1 hypothetical protein DV20_05805 [Amycolatopsis rifamycinica]
MDDSKIKTSVLSQVNDLLEIREYGHGYLLTLPLAFYDDDLITLFVEPYEGGVRVSDQGTTAMRLHMADLDLETPRVVEAWTRSIASLGGQALTAEDGMVGGWGDVSNVGQLVLNVAEATLRVDQLRWLANEKRPVQFRDRVVRTIGSVAPRPEYVTPNAPLPQTSGRTRQVTAAVGPDTDNRIYVQAMSASSRDQAAEHCYYVFSHTDVPRERVLAVAAGRRDSWPAAVLNELDDVTDVAFYGEGTDFQDQLASRIAQLRGPAGHRRARKA